VRGGRLLICLILALTCYFLFNDQPSTLDTAWHTILSQCDEEAYSRSNYAEAMQLDVVEALKIMSKRMDALRAKVTSASFA